MAPKVYLSRKMSFSAAHRLHTNDLSDEENYKIFDKCNRINGHGHNYVVKVTLFGEINETTGILMNITELKNYMNRVIQDVLDHRNLDKDVAYFKDKPSTAENISIYIWEEMKRIMGRPELLYEVEVNETDNNVAAYRGD